MANTPSPIDEHPRALRQARAPGLILRWGLVALAVSVALVAIKFTAYVLTSSTAILSDALESVVNIVTSGFTVYAVWLGNKPGDEDHPYGHGRVEYFSVGLEGLFIIAAGLSIGLVATSRLFEPSPLRQLDLGLLLMTVISVSSYAAGTVLIRAGKRHCSGAVEADGHHIRADAITSFGALIGLLLVRVTDAAWIDAAVAITIGIWLVFSGVGMVRKAVAGLMDAADPELLEAIAATLEATREPGWVAPHRAKVHRLGPKIHFDLHLVFPRYWSLERTHEATLRLEDSLRHQFGDDTESMIHMEPCTPRSCSYCDIEACPVRSSPFVERYSWSGEHIAAKHRPTARSADDAS